MPPVIAGAGVAAAAVPAVIIGGTAYAGSQKDIKESTKRVDMIGMSAEEQRLASYISNQSQEMDRTGLIGGADQATAMQSSRDLAELLKQYQQGAYLPSQNDISTSNQYAQDLFQWQREQQRQNFVYQTTEANRRAAVMGRSLNDPILANKLAQEQTRQQSSLNAQQGSWATQFALQQPGMRLDFAKQRAATLNLVGDQAVANRQYLMALGQQNLANERNYRLAQSGATVTDSSGGGLKGGIAGGIQGANFLMGLVSGGMGMGGGAGGGNSSNFGSSPASSPIGAGSYFGSSYQPSFGVNQPKQYGQFGGF